MYIPTIPTFSLDSSLCWCSCLKMMVLEGICRPSYITYVRYTEYDLRLAATEPVCLASSTPGTGPYAALCACLPVRVQPCFGGPNTVACRTLWWVPLRSCKCSWAACTCRGTE